MEKTPILPPFKRFCVTIGNLPSSYVDSMSYYECLMWLCKYLKDTVIPAVNENAVAVNELINWFNNLDVQDEIDKKLDEMVESGELQNIIGAYVDEYVSETNQRLDNMDSSIEELQTKDKSNNGASLSLQNYIIYDLGDTDYTQGSCVGDDGTIYVYKSNTSYNGGELLVFNNEELTSTISDINFYHGNCLTYLNGRIYSASFNTKKIVSYELNTGITLELDPFIDITDYNKIVGISKYDENHLLCTLYNTDTIANSSSPKTAYILDIRDNSFVELPLTNTKGIRENYYATQGMCYKDNHIYITTSYPNMILDYVESNGSANLDKTYVIPLRDELGLLLGETEDISPTSEDGKFLLTTHYMDHDNSYKTLLTHFISFDYDLDPVYYQYVDIDLDYDGYRQALYVDNNKAGQTLYEDGSQLHPFKTMRRGLVSANYGKYYDRKNVVVVGHNTSNPYHIGMIYNINGVAIVDMSDKVVIDSLTQFINCDICFAPSANDNISVGTMLIRNTKFRSITNRLEVSSYFDIDRNSDVSFFSILQSGTGNLTPLLVRQGCKCQCWFSGTPASTATNLITLAGDCLVVSNIDISKVYSESGQGVYIKTGSKLGS